MNMLAAAIDIAYPFTDEGLREQQKKGEPIDYALVVSKRTRSNEHRKELGLDLLRRHRKALDALARFRDYSLNRMNAVNDPWFRRTYLEIQLVSSAALALGLARGENLDGPVLVRCVKGVVDYSNNLLAKDFWQDIQKSLDKSLLDIADRLSTIRSVNGGTVEAKCNTWRARIIYEANQVNA